MTDVRCRSCGTVNVINDPLDATVTDLGITQFGAVRRATGRWEVVLGFGGQDGTGEGWSIRDAMRNAIDDMRTRRFRV